MINTRVFSRYEPLQQLADKGFWPSKVQSLKTSRTRTRHPVVQLPCCPYSGKNWLSAKDACLFSHKLMQTKLPQSRPALTQNLCAKKHSVTVYAAFHFSLRPRDGKEKYAVALGFDIMRNVVIERKQPSSLHLDDLFLSVNPYLARE
jgi:hypothetical protein